MFEQQWSDMRKMMSLQATKWPVALTQSFTRVYCTVIVLLF
jgi:hypothetical protein